MANRPQFPASNPATVILRVKILVKGELEFHHICTKCRDELLEGRPRRVPATDLERTIFSSGRLGDPVGYVDELGCCKLYQPTY